jgi:hypothetical protein
VTAVKQGDRVRLVSTTDIRTRLQPGTEGTVTFIDAVGTVHVAWDDGSTLGMVHAAGDRFEVIHEGSE